MTAEVLEVLSTMVFIMIVPFFYVMGVVLQTGVWLFRTPLLMQSMEE